MGRRLDFEKRVGKELVNKLNEAGLMGAVYDIYNDLTDNHGIPTVVARHRALNQVVPTIDPDWQPLTSADMDTTDARVMAGRKYSDYEKNKSYFEILGIAETPDENHTPAAEGVSKGGREEGQPVKSGASTSPAFIDPREPIPPGKQVNIPKHVMDRAADVVETIEWVAKNIEQPFCMEVIETAPCGEAVGLLRYYSSSDHHKGDFWKEQYARLIPSRSQLSHRGKVEFDGKDVLDAIENIKSGLLDFELEGSL